MNPAGSFSRRSRPCPLSCVAVCRPCSTPGACKSGVAAGSGTTNPGAWCRRPRWTSPSVRGDRQSNGQARVERGGGRRNAAVGPRRRRVGATRGEDLGAQPGHDLDAARDSPGDVPADARDDVVARRNRHAVGAGRGVGGGLRVRADGIVSIELDVAPARTATAREGRRSTSLRRRALVSRTLLVSPPAASCPNVAATRSASRGPSARS